MNVPAIKQQMRQIQTEAPVSVLHAKRSTDVARVIVGRDWLLVIEATLHDADLETRETTTAFTLWKCDGTSPFPLETGTYAKCYEAMRQRVREIVAW